MACLCLALTACGVQRPLIKPKDIPAYEQKQQQKRDNIEQEQRELDAERAAREQQRLMDQQAAPAASVP